MKSSNLFTSLSAQHGSSYNFNPLANNMEDDTFEMIATDPIGNVNDKTSNVQNIPVETQPHFYDKSLQTETSSVNENAVIGVIGVTGVEDVIKQPIDTIETQTMIELKNETSGLKNEISELKKEIMDMKTEMTYMKNYTDKIETDLEHYSSYYSELMEITRRNMTTMYDDLRKEVSEQKIDIRKEVCEPKIDIRKEVCEPKIEKFEELMTKLQTNMLMEFSHMRQEIVALNDKFNEIYTMKTEVEALNDKLNSTNESLDVLKTLKMVGRCTYCLKKSKYSLRECEGCDDPKSKLLCTKCYDYLINYDMIVCPDCSEKY